MTLQRAGQSSARLTCRSTCSVVLPRNASRNRCTQIDRNTWIEIAATRAHRCEDLERGHVAGAGHNDIGVARIIARPLPDADSGSAGAGGRVDVEPLPFQLLAGDDQVDVIPAPEAVIGHAKQAIGVWRQINSNDFGAFVRDMIDEAWILMGKSVVILPPHQRGEQIVERNDRLPPGHVPGGLQPFCNVRDLESYVSAEAECVILAGV